MSGRLRGCLAVILLGALPAAGCTALSETGAAGQTRSLAQLPAAVGTVLAQ